MQTTLNKRIPLQSSISGFSKKAWIKFIDSLTDLECEHILNSKDVTATICASIVNKMVKAGFQRKHFKRLSDVSNYDPPAKRLVCVEENPGPDKKLIVTKQIVKNKKKTKQPKQLIVPPRNIVNPGNSIRTEYLNTLRDPWEHGPIKLGYDTYVPTLLATAYLRNSFTVNADGSFGIFMVPSVNGIVYTNVAGAAVATWVAQNSSNSTAISNLCLEARVVSGGLRVMCLFPRTSAPGVLFSGIDCGRSTTSLISLTPNFIAGLPSSTIGIGSSGCRAISLPIDPDSFTFTNAVATSYAVGTIPTQSSCVIGGLGFPVGTVVWFEAILNLEALPVSNASGNGMDMNNPPSQNTLSNYFPSAANLINSIRGAIGSAAVMDASLAALDIASSMGSTRARSVATGIRSTFGAGSHTRNVLYAGASERQRSRQNNITIEEMKEYEQV